MLQDAFVILFQTVPKVSTFTTFLKPLGYFSTIIPNEPSLKIFFVSRKFAYNFFKATGIQSPLQNDFIKLTISKIRGHTSPLSSKLKLKTLFPKIFQTLVKLLLTKSCSLTKLGVALPHLVSN